MKATLVIFLALALSSISAQNVVFNDKDSSRSSASSPVTRAIGTDNRDSIVVEAAGANSRLPADGEPNTRIFPGLFNGFFGGVFGSIKHKDACLNYCGVGNPHLSSQCCSLGFQQCCISAGFPGSFGNPGGIGSFPGFGGIKPGVCPGLFGFRSNDVNGVTYGQQGGYLRSADSAESRARQRRDDSIKFGDEAGVRTGAAAEVNPRFFGLFDGLFGIQKCNTDFECPGQLKCCNQGFKSTCTKPSFFG